MTNTWHFLIRESFLGSFCLRSKVTSSSSSSSRSFSQSFFKRLMRPWKMRFWRPASLGPKSWSPSEPMSWWQYVNWINATTLLPSTKNSKILQLLNNAEHLAISCHRPESFSSSQCSLQRFALSSASPWQLWGSPHPKHGRCASHCMLPQRKEGAVSAVLFWVNQECKARRPRGLDW